MLMPSDSRDEFPERVKRTIAERSAYICANPACRRPTVGPHSDPNKSLKTGQACHIRAAAPGGPRYDARQTPEQRRDIENAIWLCAQCSALVDGDVTSYPIDLLVGWRRDHEAWLRDGASIPSLPQVSIRTLSGLSVTDVPGTIMAQDCQDFREHCLKVENISDVEIRNIVARVQLPEPIVLGCVRDHPAGVHVDFPPIRMRMVGLIKGGGTITRNSPSLPTNVHQLKVDRIPSSHSVEIALFTSTKFHDKRGISFDRGDSCGFDHPPFARDFIDGTYQFQYRGAVVQRRFFAPLGVDRDKRQISVVEVREDPGPWKPVEVNEFS